MPYHLIETKLNEVKRLSCNIPIKLYFGNIEKKTLYFTKDLNEEETFCFKDYFNDLREYIKKCDSESNGDIIDVFTNLIRMTNIMILLYQIGLNDVKDKKTNEKIDLFKNLQNSGLFYNREIDTFVINKKDNGLLYYKFDETKFSKNNIKFQME
jgi:hypothetical protein